MADLPRGAKSALARACGVSPTSVNDWTSGKTQMPTADLIFPAARFLNVSAEWLATGRGPMHSQGQEGVKGQPGLSQSVGLDPQRMAKAFLFARTYLAARGMAGPVDAYPGLVAKAFGIIAAIEAQDDKAELVEVLGRMADEFGSVSNDVLADGGRG